MKVMMREKKWKVNGASVDFHAVGICILIALTYLMSFLCNRVNCG